MEAPILFDPSDAQHKFLFPQMAEIHMACIETDKTIATFLPPLDHDRITKWYEEEARPVEYGASEIVMQFVPVGEGSNTRKVLGGFVMLKRRINADGKLTTETGPFRGDILKLLVSPNHRGKGIARRVMEKLEEVALKTGVSLLLLDTEVGSAAENIYPRLGYTRIGIVPKYGISPIDNKTLKDEVFFYKDLRQQSS